MKNLMLVILVTITSIFIYGCKTDVICTDRGNDIREFCYGWNGIGKANVIRNMSIDTLNNNVSEGVVYVGYHFVGIESIKPNNGMVVLEINNSSLNGKIYNSNTVPENNEETVFYPIMGYDASNHSINWEEIYDIHIPTYEYM